MSLLHRTKVVSPIAACAVTSLAALQFALALCCALPTQAFAKSHREYDIRQVDISAWVLEDGTLDVWEERRFDFDGTFHGVYWDISEDAAEFGDCQVEVVSAGWNHDTFEPFSEDNVQFFAQDYSNADGTYTVENVNKNGTPCVRVTLYQSQRDAAATYFVNYRVTGDVAAWADCGELYWKFVSDGWDERSQNVSCYIALPVPEGQMPQAGQDVRVWQHHRPLTGNVTFEGNVITCTVPSVSTRDFAEVRATFPVEWLTQMTPRSEAHLQTVLDEEATWANEANARRDAESARNTGFTLAGLLLALASCLFGVIHYIRYRKSHKAQFTGDYFRDVPSDDHPAVLDFIWDGGAGGSRAMSATLMHLEQLGAIRLYPVDEQVADPRGNVHSRKDYAMICVPQIQLQNPIDVATMEFLFGFVAPHYLSTKRAEPRQAGEVRFNDINAVAFAFSSSYESELKKWKSVVEEQVKQRDIKKDTAKDRSGLPVLLGLLELALAIVVVVLFAFFDSAKLSFLSASAALLVSGIAMLIFAGMERSLSREAIEIRAKLNGLKKWLEDFTALNEAVPQAVTVWNKLMIMAVVLGVAEKALENLRVAAPQVVNDVRFHNTAMWCHGTAGMPAAS
ncbi:MAG: DUF2207 domain-containing protein, partial [Eggerthellaceae bacterium]|nr:DUF2207 domain-containing protein [Eggerthellaceae bacterium]